MEEDEAAARRRATRPPRRRALPSRPPQPPEPSLPRRSRPPRLRRRAPPILARSERGPAARDAGVARAALPRVGRIPLRLEPPDLARLRELPGSKGKTDRELGESFFDGAGGAADASRVGRRARRRRRCGWWWIPTRARRFWRSGSTIRGDRELLSSRRQRRRVVAPDVGAEDVRRRRGKMGLALMRGRRGDRDARRERAGPRRARLSAQRLDAESRGTPRRGRALPALRSPAGSSSFSTLARSSRRRIAFSGSSGRVGGARLAGHEGNFSATSLFSAAMTENS